jgi:hypothetical protein
MQLQVQLAAMEEAMGRVETLAIGRNKELEAVRSSIGYKLLTAMKLIRIKKAADD